MGSNTPVLEDMPPHPEPLVAPSSSAEIAADLSSRVVEALGADLAAQAVEAELGFLNHYALRENCVEVLDSLADASRMACFERMVMRTYQPGAFIVQKGSEGNTLYFLEDGTASAVDADRRLHSFGKGCVLGESAFVPSIKQAMGVGVVSSEETRWPWDVVAATDCVFWELDVETFVEVCC
jgi:hypothetical protein